MAINFETTNPHALLALFKKGIDDGKIDTWSYDSDGDFTHTPEQWKHRAWLRPVVYQGHLTMNILGRKNETMPLVVYAVYHGRFIEAMIAHCRRLFSTGTATALPTNSDAVTIIAA